MGGLTMAIRVEHEIHERRKGRNYGVLLLLLGLIAIVFGLTVVKALNLGDIRELESFDHVSRPAIVTDWEEEAAPAQMPAAEQGGTE
jgi:hypothetical protein